MATSVFSWGADRVIEGNTVKINVDTSNARPDLTLIETLVGDVNFDSTNVGVCQINANNPKLLICNLQVGLLNVLGNPISYGTIGVGTVSGTLDAQNIDAAESNTVPVTGNLNIGVQAPNPPLNDVGPVCGNSKMEAGEECDDGNPVGGDGCSSDCRTEQQFLNACVLRDYATDAPLANLPDVGAGYVKRHIADARSNCNEQIYQELLITYCQSSLRENYPTIVKDVVYYLNDGSVGSNGGPVDGTKEYSCNNPPPLPTKEDQLVSRLRFILTQDGKLAQVARTAGALRCYFDGTCVEFGQSSDVDSGNARMEGLLIIAKTKMGNPELSNIQKTVSIAADLRCYYDPLCSLNN